MKKPFLRLQTSDNTTILINIYNITAYEETREIQLLGDSTRIELEQHSFKRLELALEELTSYSHVVIPNYY